jgi:hypothetical protein
MLVVQLVAIPVAAVLSLLLFFWRREAIHEAWETAHVEHETGNPRGDCCDGAVTPFARQRTMAQPLPSEALARRKSPIAARDRSTSKGHVPC